MSTKELAIDTIQGLPENASWQDIEERIHFLAAIDKAQEEIRQGKFVSHEEVRAQLEQWLTE
ncbi:MAG: hypothetical protein CFE26_00810 [Verrucomicrobiales bacterium VVV1]|jgi:predicted transcriptional regulator|nr:MAG: hypothetical protein CFE26_00810 [Verrucomicrobiales bacterium VVV1]